MERKIAIIVAEADQTCDNECDSNEGYNYDQGCGCLRFDQEILSINDLFKKQWFLEILENKGFYSKDNEDIGEKYQYKNRFVYELRRDNESYPRLQKEIPYYDPYSSLRAVYQEVIGPERIKAVQKWTKQVKEYERKQAEIKKKATEKSEANKELRKLKKLEKAKQLIKELEGTNEELSAKTD